MCGIVGLIGSPRASEEVYQALLMLQHRGQDSAGILSVDELTGKFHLHKALGQVGQVFNREKLAQLPGRIAIGHTRYSTIGDIKEQDLQPMVTALPVGIGMIHNGNVSNYEPLRLSLKQDQRYFLSDNDLELILHQVANEVASGPKNHQIDALMTGIEKVMKDVEGGYSVIGLLGSQGLFAFRDPHGIRPLILGERELESGEKSYCITSETCALNFLGYQIVRDIQAGELIWIGTDGKIFSKKLQSRLSLPCMFEWVYFSSAESTLDNQNVYSARLKLGELLAKRIPSHISIDVVAPVPETSRPAAIALAEHLGRPFREILIKNRYVQRSFITHGQDKRNLAVKLKFSVIRELVEGKSILLVDDSIVRGTTSRKIIDLLKSHGAAHVYLASTCPPITHPCFYGIDFPSNEELVAYRRNLTEITEHLHADGVFYTTLGDLNEALSQKPYCRACLDGEYPYPIQFNDRKDQIRC